MPMIALPRVKTSTVTMTKYCTIYGSPSILNRIGPWFTSIRISPLDITSVLRISFYFVHLTMSAAPITHQRSEVHSGLSYLAIMGSLATWASYLDSLTGIFIEFHPLPISLQLSFSTLRVLNPSSCLEFMSLAD